MKAWLRLARVPFAFTAATDALAVGLLAHVALGSDATTTRWAAVLGAAMLVYAFGLATGRLIDKSVAGQAPPLAYAFLDNLPAVLIGAAILLFRGRLSDVMSLHRERTKIAWVGAVSGMGAYVMLLLALRDLKPSVVEPVTQLSVFIAVGMGGLWFGEQTRTRWLPSLLLVVGAVLLLWKG